jgi:hypothetical protein
MGRNAGQCAAGVLRKREVTEKIGELTMERDFYPERLSRGRPFATPGSGTIGPALAAAPAKTPLRGHKVVGCKFVAVSAAAWRQDGPTDVLRGEKREY